MKPECFSLIAVYDAASECCKKCPAQQACVDTAYLRALEIHKEIDIGVELGVLRANVSQELKVLKWGAPRRLPHKHASKKKVIKPTALQQQYMKLLPVNVEAAVRQCFEKGIDVQAMLISKQNPFQNEKPKFMKAACALLLDRPDGVTSLDLRKHFVNEFRWSNKTARSKAWVALKALEVFGLRQQGGRYFIEELS